MTTKKLPQEIIIKINLREQRRSIIETIENFSMSLFLVLSFLSFYVNTVKNKSAVLFYALCVLAFLGLCGMQLFKSEIRKKLKI